MSAKLKKKKKVKYWTVATFSRVGLSCHFVGSKREVNLRAVSLFGKAKNKGCNTRLLPHSPM
jgi:hypothetical protein